MLADARPICWRITAAETRESYQRRLQPRRKACMPAFESAAGAKKYVKECRKLSLEGRFLNKSVWVGCADQLAG